MVFVALAPALSASRRLRHRLGYLRPSHTHDRGRRPRRPSAPRASAPGREARAVLGSLVRAAPEMDDGPRADAALVGAGRSISRSPPNGSIVAQASDAAGGTD